MKLHGAFIGFASDTDKSRREGEVRLQGGTEQVTQREETTDLCEFSERKGMRGKGREGEEGGGEKEEGEGRRRRGRGKRREEARARRDQAGLVQGAGRGSEETETA